jgi:hypothetical protein
VITQIWAWGAVGMTLSIGHCDQIGMSNYTMERQRTTELTKKKVYQGRRRRPRKGMLVADQKEGFEA